MSFAYNNTSMFLIFFISFFFITANIFSQYSDDKKSNKSIIQKNNDNYLKQPVKKNKIDSSSWKEATQGLDYTQEYNRDKKKRTEYKNYENYAFFIKWVIILLFLTGIGILIYKLFQNKFFISSSGIKSNKEKTKNFNINDSPEQNIYEFDLEHKLKEALKMEDFNQAVRFYYLIVIKTLSQNFLIYWMPEKTNYEYIRELRNTDYYDTFKALTLIYEKVWYGQFQPTNQDWQEWKLLFDDFIKKIDKEEIFEN